MNGIIIVKKEKGFTSHDVVAKLRGILQKKKIGHTGTLDPDATGVLPVCVGKATKVCDLLTNKDKTYVAEVKLGITTDTLDMTGEVLSQKEVQLSEEDLRKTLEQFRGNIEQVPPMYSAIKVNGKKLYELARKGIEVERKARTVTIHELILQDISLEKQEFTIEVTCSKGTYIRSLCHDIGEVLGCGAAMKSLVRTKVGQFSLEQAKTLSEIQELMPDVEDLFISIDKVFEEHRRCDVASGAMKYLRNGNAIKSSMVKLENPVDCERVRMYGDDGEFYAIYCYHAEDDMYHVVKMFHV